MKNLKVLLILIFSLVSYSNNLVGPKHKLNTSLGYEYIKSSKMEKDSSTGSNVKVNSKFSIIVFQAEYVPNRNKKLDEKWDINIGPVIGATLKTYLGTQERIENSSTIIKEKEYLEAFGHLGFSYSFDYKINKKSIYLYIGQSLGIQLGAKIDLDRFSANPYKFSYFGFIRTQMGIKLANNYHLGAYLGYGQGIIGLETGYTW